MAMPRSKVEPSTFGSLRISRKNCLILCYVYDLLVIGSDVSTVQNLKKSLRSRLPANGLGLARDFLGMKLSYGEGSVTISQTKYAKAIFHDMGLTDCAPMKVPTDSAIDISMPDPNHLSSEEYFLYRRNIGKLIYIATHTRPDISVVISMLAKHVQKPGKMHEAALLKLLKYLKGTQGMALQLKAGS